MRLEKATHKAIKYACLKYHYAKAVPTVAIGYSVFNNDGDWCGCIVYNHSNSPNLRKTYDLNSGQLLELSRMALNGKQKQTSKALAISLRLLKRDAPTVKLVVSFADTNQGHKGTIYQATNWIYNGKSVATDEFLLDGKPYNRRTLTDNYKTVSNAKAKLGSRLTIIRRKQKNRYLYVFDKSLIESRNIDILPYPTSA